jgi:2-polyprenyl-3-methyl-5-hydroxy-6-metoxy-1,4-benzoquinol methylase
MVMNLTEEEIFYFKDIQDFFSSVTDKTVLEIGAKWGYHTDIILKNNPKKLTLMDSSEDYCNILKNKFKNYNNVEILCDDAFLSINQNSKKIDVVTLLGVLYHFHSPLHLIELIINHLKPQTIILDYPTGLMEQAEFQNNFFVTGAVDLCRIRHEQTNYKSWRNTRKDWKSINYSIVIPLYYIHTSLKDIGYKATIISNPKEQYPEYKKMMTFITYEKGN